MRSPDGAITDAADFVRLVNRELCQNNDDMMFVTLFFGMLQPQTGELRYCNAGHNLPYLINSGVVEAIEGAKGTVLGVDDKTRYTTGHRTIAAGASLYLYTDGVTKRPTPTTPVFRRPAGSAYARTRLCATR